MTRPTRRRARLRLDTLEARAVPANLLVSYTDAAHNEVVGEFTPAGEPVGSAHAVPPNGGADTGFADARDVVRAADGRLLAFNGTFEPTLAAYAAGTNSWTQTPYAGWSTVNNVSFGGLTALGRYAYAPDMATAGGEPVGIVRFDLTDLSATRFLSGQEYTDVSVGLDGKLYALQGDNGPVDVIDPGTMTVDHSFYPGGGFFSTVSTLRGVAADAAGNVFVVSWDEAVYKLSPTGTELGHYNMTGPGGSAFFGDTQDVDVSSDGTRLVIGSRFGWVVQMATDFTDVSYFQAGDQPVFVAFNEPPGPPVAPDISVGDATVAEGDTGTAALTFTVRLSEPTTATVTVDYATAAGTAAAGNDYATTSGTLTFDPGQTEKTVTVNVTGDVIAESDETLSLVLSDPVRGTLADDTGVGTIVNDDVPPVASAGPDRTINENGVVTFRATGSSGVRPLTYTWDFGDGSPTATGFAPLHRFLDSGTFTVTLTVRDVNGSTATDTAVVTSRNLAPRGGIAGPTRTVASWVRPLTFFGFDPSPVDRAALEYRIDWGDGQQQLLVDGPKLVTGHAYANTGDYTVGLVVADKDGLASRTYTRVVHVRPTLSENGILYVPGTDADDIIEVKALNAAGTRVQVTVDGSVAATGSPNTVVVLARDGWDTVRTDGPVRPRLVFMGGPGLDTLNAASAVGPVVLVGADGNDFMTGGSGRDVLVGGSISDVMAGGGNDDLLLGETLSFEADPLAVRKLGLEWARAGVSYETRRDHLLGVRRGGLNGTSVLTANTVFADGSRDAMTGGDGRDWFFDLPADGNLLINAAADETVTTTL